ncbi:hypothetical protein G6644_00725 [Polynucleobacter paneuropaeus]|nr:hypothetical protein [Polynucleobacter paneuropaeus]MBT8637585.1 hypothetical protein [Polynucleobacter paneuropaeus]
MLKKHIQKFDRARSLYLILFFELINVFYYLYYFFGHGYLPSPFVSDKNDTFMDFYNPLFWVIKDGFYTTFSSVYPALNYFFLKIFSFGIALDQTSNPFQFRNDFPILGLIISLIYVLIIWVVVNIGEWRKVDFGHKGLIFLACMLSVPVLFGLERGNLIFLALLFLALYLNATSPWIKALCFGCLVNVKPYFAILLLQYLNIHHFNKIALIRSVLVALVIFFGFGLLAGMDFIDFVKAYISFSKNTTLSAEGVIALPHSIAALSAIKRLIDFGDGSSYTFWFSLLKAINYIFVVLLAYVTLVKKVNPTEILLASMVILTNFSISTGGYILIIYIILIPYLLKNKEYSKLLIFIILIYTLPLDWIYVLSIKHAIIESYIGGGLLINNPDLFISLGSIVRPLLNFILMISFATHLIKKYPGNFFSKTSLN